MLTDPREDIESKEIATKAYREEYLAGTRESKGYVKSFLYKVEVPCRLLVRVHHHHSPITSYNYSRTRYYQPVKPVTSYRSSGSNSSSSACRSSRATGGVLGGGFAAAVSKKDAWAWTIPLGAVIGLGVGDANC